MTEREREGSVRLETGDNPRALFFGRVNEVLYKHEMLKLVSQQ